MAKTKISAKFSDGSEIKRTTTLGLTHAWRFVRKRTDGTLGGSTGFAGSQEKAEAAVRSEANKSVRWSGGEIVSTEVVPVTVHA